MFGESLAGWDEDKKLKKKKEKIQASKFQTSSGPCDEKVALYR